MKKLIPSLIVLAALSGLVRAQDATQTAKRVVVGVSNASSTGTTLHRLAKLTGAPSKAVIVATTDTDGALGVVVGTPGTSGVATIQTGGQSMVSAGGAATSTGRRPPATTCRSVLRRSASATRPARPTRPRGRSSAACSPLTWGRAPTTCC